MSTIQLSKLYLKIRIRVTANQIHEPKVGTLARSKSIGSTENVSLVSNIFFFIENTRAFLLMPITYYIDYSNIVIRA